MKLNEINAISEAINKRNKKWLQPDLKPWMYQNASDIKAWVKLVGLENRVMLKPHELELDGTGDIFIGESTLSGPGVLVKHNGKNYLPVQFNLATGFTISGPSIESLVGSPRVVLERYRIENVNLTDLEGFPELVNGRSIIRSLTKLKSLKGISQKIKQLELLGETESLEGLPPTIEEIMLMGAIDLKQLVALGPKLMKIEIGEHNFKQGNLFELFKLKKLISIYLSDEGMFNKPSEPVQTLNKILNKHLKTTKDPLECQEDLIEAGLEDYL